jgi:dihydroorotase
VIDLAITGGRVIDPASGLDGAGTVAVDAGRIVTTNTGVEARRTIDAAGLIVAPGLVDLHVHVYPGVSHYGVEPDEHCLLRGVTTAVDTGSAGAATFPGFRRWVIEPARTRVLAFLHIAVEGMISALVGELEDPRWASPALSVVCAREHPDVIVGIKVRLGYQMVGQDPERAFVAARKAADRLELPLMVHVIDLPRPLSWLLPRLGEGDVVTHCFHGSEGGSLLDERGRVIPEAREARERGVLFDVGHGVGSFTFRVARAALEQGFPPDTISSDIHVYNVDGPVFDQPTTLSKLLHLGMELPAVIEATTAAPAGAVRRADTIGALAPGREADVTVLELVDGEHDLVDAAEEHERAAARLVPRWVVRGGDVVEAVADYAAPSNSSA